jgi:hypothetical protein
MGFRTLVDAVMPKRRNLPCRELNSGNTVRISTNLMNMKSDSCSAGQEVPLWKRNFHCHVHKNAPLDSVQRQLSLLQTSLF